MERAIDLAAIARVAKRSELKSLRLVAIKAECNKSVMGTLVPSVDLNCKPARVEGNALEVICEYKFTAHSNAAVAVSSTFTYLLDYAISGGESPSAGDLAEFANANGALNSWPFVREVLFGLTSRMGFPPYTLPLMHFNPTPKTKEPAQKPATPAVETPVAQ